MRIKMEHLLMNLQKKLGDNFLNVDITAYVDKLLANAKIVSIMNGEELEAFIAFYDNDEKMETAFITQLAVGAEHWGKSYGEILMETTTKILKKAGFKYIEARYISNYPVSLKFAQMYGFELIKKNDIEILRKVL